MKSKGFTFKNLHFGLGCKLFIYLMDLTSHLS